MRLSIKFKILFNNVVIVALCLIISGAMAYNYFNSILEKKLINEENDKIAKTAFQLQTLQNDLRSMARIILFNSDLIRLLGEYRKSSSTAEKIFAEKEIGDELGGLIGIKEKDHILRTFVMTREGDLIQYGTLGGMDLKAVFIHDDWYKLLLKGEAFEGFEKSYEIKLSEVERQKAFTYLHPIINVNEKREVLGTLVILVKQEMVEGLLDSSRSDGATTFWVSDRGKVLYSNAGESAEGISEGLLASVEESSEGNPEEFIFRQHSSGYNWQVATVVPREVILSSTRHVLNFFFILTVLSILTIVLLSLPIIINILRPIQQFTKTARKISSGDFDAQLTIRNRDEFALIAQAFNQMTADMKEHTREMVEHQEYKKNMQLNLLMSRINPHFIYNTLNTVIYLADEKRNEEIVKMVRSFIHLLYDVVRINQDELYATLAQEKEFVEDYVRIMKYRYPERFELQWQIEESLAACLIPKTMIQPLVENALYHGVLLKEGKGTITVSGSLRKGDIEIVVQDDGVGMTQEEIDTILQKSPDPSSGGAKMRSIGIGNIMERIRYLYGEQYALSICSEPGRYTRVTLRLPA